MKPKKGRVIKLKDILPRRRNAVPRAFKALSELGMLQEAQELIESGNLGVNEAYTMVIPESVMEEYGISDLKAVVRPIKKYLRTRYKNKYSAMARHTAEGPTVYIIHPGPGA